MRELARAVGDALAEARPLVGSLTDAGEEIRCTSDPAACAERVTELLARAERQHARLAVVLARLRVLRSATPAPERDHG